MMPLHAPRPIEILGGLFVLGGLLAFFLIDTDDPVLGENCRALDCPPVPAWKQALTVQALFVILGFFGLGLLLWGSILRARDESP